MYNNNRKHHGVIKLTIVLMITMLLFVMVVPYVWAASFTVTVYPNAIDGTDTTTETLSEITANDAICLPDSESAVVASDGCYTVDKGAVMRFSSFDTSAIVEPGSIDGVRLYLEAGAEDGYGGTNFVHYLNSSSVLTPTAIQSSDLTGWNTNSYDIYANDSAAVDTLTEITNMDIEFASNDDKGASAFHFDYLYMEVDYSATSTILGPATTTDPLSVVIAPGGSPVVTDAFTLKTDAGTDTVTEITLAHKNASSTAKIEIVSNDGSTVYGSTTAAVGTSTSIILDTNISVTTTETTYKIRTTPKSHANLPYGNKGDLIPFTATVLSWTGTNLTTGLDIAVPAIIDNQSLPYFGFANASTTYASSTYAVTSTANYMTIADFNGDGFDDFVASNYSQGNISVYINNGDGTFASVVYYGAEPGNYVYGIASADIDGDGDDDVAAVSHTASNSNGTVTFFFNDGDGTFDSATTSITTGGGTSEVISLDDINNDGYVDMALGAQTSSGSTFQAYLNDGDGVFTLAYEDTFASYAGRIISGDFNNDNNIDYAFVTIVDDRLRVVLGNGDGTFGSPSTYIPGVDPQNVSAADLDGDGYLDLVVTNSTDSDIEIFTNDGDGTFTSSDNIATPSIPFSVTINDVNQDGVLDIIVGGSPNIMVLLGKGDGTFNNADIFSTVLSTKVGVSDFDHNGQVDILASNGYNNSLTVLLANASSSLVATTSGVSAGEVLLSYTTPPQDDLDSIIFLASTSAITSAPTDGTTYTGEEDVGGATVVCVDSSVATATAESCTATGLDQGTTYYLAAFVKDSYGNYSFAVEPEGSPVTTAVDETAPTPDPYFIAAPNSTATDAINMVSVTVTDPATPVEYYFDAIAGSCGTDLGVGSDSGWQTSATYNDTGLSANQCYAYTVTARDSLGNTTATSTASSTYTLANIPGVITFNDIGTSTITLTNDENGNPTSDPATTFAVYATSTDSNWDGYYLTAGGSTSTSQTWLTDSQIDSLTLTELTPNILYSFRVMARNEDGVETASSTVSATTTLAIPPTLTVSAASSVSTSSATLNGEITDTGSENATTRGFIYATSSDFSSGVATTSESGSYTTGTYSLSVDSLEPATTYYVRSFAENSGGVSYSSNRSFTTLAIPPTVTVSAASSVSTSSATLNGEITDTGSENATTRGFIYSTSSDFSTGVATTSEGAYDISGTSFDSTVLETWGEESSPTAMLFNDDGTILYVLGGSGDDINAYPLPTPYDISSYTSGTSIALSVAAQEATPYAMLFNNDGTILYVMGTTGDDINAYPLDTPYDISSYTSGTSVVLDVSGQQSFPTAMLFNNDGTTLYVMGTAGDVINAYPLPTPYDISSYTSGTSVVLDVSGQETSPRDMLFNNDGTILYVLGFNGDDITAYSLDTPYDIGTVSFNSIVLDISGQGTWPAAFIFNNDGTVLYVVDESSNDINAYVTPTYTTGTYSLSVDSLEPATTYYVRSFAENSGGTAYSASTNFTTTVVPPTLTVSAASSVSTSSATLNGEITATGGENATTRGFIYSTSSDFSTGVATTSESGSYSTGVYSLSVTSLEPGATYYVKAFATNSGGTSYSASTSFTTDPLPPTVTVSAASSISTSSATLNGNITATGGENATTRGFIYSTSSDFSSGVATTSEMGGSYNISAASFGSIALSVTAQETAPTAMLFNNDGTILYVMGASGDDINAYPLPTPYDISSYTSGTSVVLDVSGQETFPWDMFFNDDGTILYVLGSSGDDINAYPLPTPYDISSYTSGTSIVLSVTAQEATPTAMLFNDDGTILYVMGDSGDDINAYPLPTPYDISSYTSGTSVVLSVTAQETAPSAMLFNDDGTILYVMGYAGQDINAYPLPTPYDISSYTSGTSVVLDVSGQETFPRDMFFNDDGTVLYVLGSSGDDINAYNISAVPTYTTGTYSLSVDSLEPATTYYVRSFAENSGGTAYSASTSFTTTGLAATTLTSASTTDPASFIIGPGTTATVTNAFTFQTDSGTDVITDVTIAHSNASSTSLIEIVSSDGATVYGSTASASGTSTIITLSTNTLTANTTETTYKIRMTPKSHANLPSGNNGELIPFTATVLSWTGSNTATGTDTAFPVIIDNQSEATFGITSTDSFATKVDYTTGSEPYSITDADFNNDGYLDLVVAHVFGTDALTVHLNDGDGTFGAGSEYQTGFSPYEVKVGDVNNDGYLDLASVSSDSSIASIFINDGDGTFAAKVDYATGAAPRGVALADINNDGYNDLIVSFTSGTDGINVFLNDGDGTFTLDNTYTTANNPYSVTVVDFDNDGYLDIAVADYLDGRVSIFINDGDGTFAAKVDYVTDSFPRIIAAADYNGDGYADIATANADSGTLSVLINDGDGTFAARVDYNAGNSSGSVSADDIDNDGHMDLVVANRGDNEVSVFMNDGDGTFDTSSTTYSTGAGPYTVTSGDFDNDGFIDVAAAFISGSPDSISVLINNATSTLTATTTGVSAGEVLLSYITPPQDDLNSIIFLASTSAITSAPTDGTTYTGGEDVGGATVVCVDSSVATSSAESCTATSLSEGTTYYFAAFVKDSYGNYSFAVSPEGSPVTTTVAPPTLTVSAASSISTSSATLNGNITATGGENATTRGFIYSTSSDFSTGVATTSESGSYTTGTYSLSIDSLELDTTYYVKAFATNSGGTSYSASTSFTTDPLPPTVTVSAASSISTSSATLNGNITATGGENATTRGFIYSTSSDFSSGVATTSEMGGSYNISAASFGSIALSVTAQETAPTAMLFNDDGTILYVMGYAGQDINAYPLPTPYDISSYTSGTSVVLDVSGQEPFPRDMFFNDDGTILYVLGSSGDDINAYPLPTPYDISSYTSGTSIVLSVAAQEATPTAMLFNDDGTILYVMGGTGQDINAYPLPTPYDISSYTSGTSVVLSVAAQETYPTSILFNDDGTVLYVLGSSGDDINAYPLPTPYDISSYTSGTSMVLSVSAQELFPYDMLFNDDGTILYVLGSSGDDINAYNISAVPTYTTGTYSLSVDSLEPATTYYVRSFAENSGGTTYSAITNFTTTATTSATVEVWNATDWTIYDTITIDPANIDSTLTDFPVYVDLADLSETFWMNTPSASSTVGTDIRVTNNSNTELPRELVFASSTLQTGELHFKADTISASANTTFKIWYNGTTTGDYATDATYGAENVWTNDYVGVWHMDEILTDSTGQNTETNNGTVATLTNAQMGYARSFNGSSDYIQTSLGHLDVVDNSTVSLWLNTNSLTDSMYIWEGDSTGNGWGAEAEAHLATHTGGEGELSVEDASGANAPIQYSYVTNTQYYVVGTFVDLNTATADYELFINGASVGTNSSTQQPLSDYDTSMRFGRPGADQHYFNGEMDEVRIASTSRSSAWVGAEYVNQSTTTDFYTVNEGIIYLADESWEDWALTTGTHTVDLTTLNLQAGDLVMATIGGGVSTNRTATVSSSGWEVTGKAYGSDSYAASMVVATKVMGTTPDTQLQYSWDTSSVSNSGFTLIRVYRNVDTTTPLDVASTTASGSNSGVINPAAITPVTTGAKVVAVGAHGIINSVGAASSNLSSSELSNFSYYAADAGSTYEAAVGIGDYDWTSGEFDPAAFSTDNNYTTQGWAAWTFVLRPASVAETVATTAVSWNATDWTDYIEIIVDPSNVDTTLYDFPVYVDLADLGAGFWSGVAEGGTDIRVTTGQGSIYEIPREVVSASTTPETGELHFKAPQLQKDIETIFRVYYNGTTTDDYATDAAYGAENVWTNDYVAVWHMEEDPSGIAPQVLDSTGNNYNATSNGTMTSTDLVAGQMGSGIDFDGIDDYLSCSTAVPNLNNPFTMSTWVDFDTANDYEGVVSFYNQNTEYVALGADPSGNFKVITSGETVNTGSSLSLGGEYLTAVFNGTSFNNYLDGTFDYSVTPSGSNWKNATICQIGWSGHTSYDEVDGVIDEVRVASTSRSASWISAEYINQNLTTDFYSTTTNAREVTLGNHDAGQVDNGFSFKNLTDQELFAFKLSTSTAGTQVTNVVLSVTSARRITDANLTNIELYLDVDNDAVYDNGTDTLVSTGSFSLDRNSGTMTFATDFTISGQGNYLVIGDTVSIDSGASMVLNLQTKNITTAGATVSGGVSAVHHSRFSGGGGSGSGVATGQVGDSTPGDGETTGGTNEGGELIGTDADYFRPTANAGSWLNAGNAYDNTDGTYATDAAGNANNFSTFNDSVPGTDAITGIAVKLEVSGTEAGGTINVQLSWDGGTSWTTAKSTPALTTTDAVVTLGGAVDTWGRAWSPTNFTNTNFALRLTGVPSSNTVQVDEVQVKVFHQASGGGGGGGGAI